MTGQVGRKALLKKDGTVLAGVRTKGTNFGDESINVTSGEDDGKRLLLEESAEEQIDIPIDGIVKDDLIRNIMLSGGTKMLTDITLEFVIVNPVNTTPATISGNFRLSGYEEGMPYNEAVTFTSTLESSGPWTFTPEAA